MHGSWRNFQRVAKVMCNWPLKNKVDINNTKEYVNGLDMHVCMVPVINEFFVLIRNVLKFFTTSGI